MEVEHIGSGKVTAVAPGSVMIIAGSNEFAEFLDETGYSVECYITVQGGAKDVKPIGMSDRTYNYGKYTLKAPGKNLYTSLNFAFLKSNDTVYLINFYLGAFGDY